MEFSVPRPSPPNTYSYVREENLGSTKKIIEIYLLFTCISNLILAIHMQSVNGLKEPFYDSGEKFLQPTRSGCTWRNRLGYPAHTGLISPSVCLFVRQFHMKTRRIFTYELKSGCPRGVFCPSSIPSEYLFLCAIRKFGFNKKICTKISYLFTCISNLILAIHMQCVNGYEEPF